MSLTSAAYIITASDFAYSVVFMAFIGAAACVACCWPRFFLLLRFACVRAQCNARDPCRKYILYLYLYFALCCVAAVRCYCCARTPYAHWLSRPPGLRTL